MIYILNSIALDCMLLSLNCSCFRHCFRGVKVKIVKKLCLGVESRAAVQG